MTIVNYKDFFKMAHINKRIPEYDALSGKYKDGITTKQKAFLRQMGIGSTGLRYKGQASIVLDEAIRRQREHLATPGQMRALTKNGMKDVHMVTFDKAVEILGGYDPEFN